VDLFLEETRTAFRPRVLEVLLGEAEGPRAELVEWSCEDPLLDGVGCWSGSALGLAQALRAARKGDELPFLLSVGDAVRRGAPTAARLTVAARSPLSGSYVEAQVGGGLARRLVNVADGVALRGCHSGPPALLWIGPRGELRTQALPEFVGLDLIQRCALMRQRFPAGRGVCVGPAAERGVPFATLATLDDPPSQTGRGGLGAAFAAHGLVALVVEAEEVATDGQSEELLDLLADSPHLQARRAGGTLELFELHHARGESRAQLDTRKATTQRQTCDGCPVGCRHIWSSPRGERRAPRFGALNGLASAIGLDDVESAFELLAECDAVGVDACEAGAALEVLDRARADGLVDGGPLRGDLAALLREVHTLADDESSSIALGAAALAERHGSTDGLPLSRGNRVFPTKDLAALLGQCVSPRGSDPLRVFPFLAESGSERTRRVLAPMAVPLDAGDPTAPAGKGRLVWWHENLANYLDASGFCAFSAAGLIADGLLDLESLSRRVPLPGLAPGAEALLAAGATLALLQRELAGLLGEEPGSDVPAWTRETLEQPGLWDEYRILRGLDARGLPSAEVRAELGRRSLARWGQAALAPVAVPAPPAPAEALGLRLGRVELEVGGPLAIALGGSRVHEGALPATLETVLRRMALRHPDATPMLWRDGTSSVSVYRSGERLAPWDLVHEGDRLNLVVAICGG